MDLIDGMPNPNVIQPGVYSCGHQGSETFINFVNPSYPENDKATGSCHFRIRVTDPNVCQVGSKEETCAVQAIVKLRV